MKPLNIKSTRPSREELRAAIYVASEGFPDGDDARVLLNELLALQQGAEELAHEWRSAAQAFIGDSRGTTAIAAQLRLCADELDKLMRGEP